ncbi:MAG: hypothetical protein C0466_06120 [Candidatus Accumulibacter sp.]|nr:hypothetical protein [Accumulibacter sp.]
MAKPRLSGHALQQHIFDRMLINSGTGIYIRDINDIYIQPPNSLLPGSWDASLLSEPHNLLLHEAFDQVKKQVQEEFDRETPMLGGSAFR